MLAIMRNMSWDRGSSIRIYRPVPLEAPRLYSGLGAVELADSYEYEMTNSLQFNVTRRVSHGLTLLSNIVWIKTIDNTSSAQRKVTPVLRTLTT